MQTGKLPASHAMTLTAARDLINFSERGILLNYARNAIRDIDKAKTLNPKHQILNKF